MIAFYETRKNDFVAQKREKLQCAAHLHHHLELVLFLEGESVGYADTEQCVICPGDAFLAFPDQVHRYEARGKEISYIFIVDPNLMPELSHFFNGRLPSSALLKGAAADAQILSLAEQLLGMKKAQTVLEKSIQRGLLLALFGKLLSRCNLTDTRTDGSHTFRAVVEYCSKNYQKELSLSILERELHVSKYYISHLFSDRMKLSFNDYVNSLRVAHACRHLCGTEMTVTQICSAVGFSTLRTFNRAFQKQMGQTPSEYRKAKGKDKP